MRSKELGHRLQRFRIHLGELSHYFETDPYREWFDRSFEPLLAGVGASYYPGRDSRAIHTDIASPVPTDPTWSKSTQHERALHSGGAELWRRLVDLLAPDLIVTPVARRHLGIVSGVPVDGWTEIARIERVRPFVVRGTRMSVADGSKQALVVFGRCTNVPFGSVNFDDRRRIGEQIATLLEEQV